MAHINDRPQLNEMNFDDNVEYGDLYDVISFEDFNFEEWLNGERNILMPRLKEAGYSDIEFSMGERDSFGPLSRVCKARKDGTTHWFVYG
jgi:hypothetical protein